MQPLQQIDTHCSHIPQPVLVPNAQNVTIENHEEPCYPQTAIAGARQSLPPSQQQARQLYNWRALSHLGSSQAMWQPLMRK